MTNRMRLVSQVVPHWQPTPAPAQHGSVPVGQSTPPGSHVVVPLGGGPDALRALIAAERARMAGVIRAAGIRLE
jgi:hypothetical protein